MVKKKKTEQPIEFHDDSEQQDSLYDKLQSLLVERQRRRHEHYKFLKFYKELNIGVNHDESGETPIRVLEIRTDMGMSTLDGSLTVSSDEIQIDNKYILKAIYEVIVKYNKLIMDLEVQIAELCGKLGVKNQK